MIGNENIPSIRFPEFNGFWKVSSLSNEAEINPKSPELPERFIYVDLESVTNGILIKEEEISSIEAPARAQRVLKSGDILYQTVRPYQKNNLLFERKGEYVASTGYAQIRSMGDNRFLYQLLHITPFVNIVNRWSTGTSYPAISPSELVKIKINFPSLPEQQKIADFLSTVDKKIQALTRKKELLEQYKKGVMQKIFKQEIRFRREDGSDFEEWKEKRLGELLTIGSGKDYKHLSRGEIPVYGTGGLMLKVNNYLYEGESVGIGRKGTIDKPIFLKGKFWTVDTLFYTHSFIDVLPFFIYVLFQTINWYKYNEASGVPSLSKSTLEKIKIAVPAMAEQAKITSFFQSIDSKNRVVDIKINSLKTWKKGLLQQMFV